MKTMKVPPRLVLGDDLKIFLQNSQGNLKTRGQIISKIYFTSALNVYSNSVRFPFMLWEI